MRKYSIIIVVILLATLACGKLPRPREVVFQDGNYIVNDSTPPVVVSVTAEAGNNQIRVEFSEPVFGTPNGNGDLQVNMFSFNDANSAGATAIDSLLDANGADSVILITTDANIVLGDNADSIEFLSGIYDIAGNALASVSRVISIQALPLTIVSAETMDLNQNGIIDHYKIVFNKNINDQTFPEYQNTSTLGNVTSTWQVSGRTGVRIDPTLAIDIDNDTTIYLAFAESGAPDSGQLPDITTTASPGLQGLDGTLLNQVSSGTIAETDKAPAVLYSATEKAGEKELVLSFSEAVFTNNNGTGNLVQSDFVYTDNNSSGATAIAAVIDGNGADAGIVLEMDALFIKSDDATDRITVVTNQIFGADGLAAVNCKIGANCDSNGDFLLVTITDGDRPTISSAETLDIDGNGKIDHYKITFDVPVKDNTFPGFAGNNNLGTVTTEWQISGRTNVRIDTRDAVPPAGPGDTGTDDNVIFLAFDEVAGICGDNDQSGCDTGVKPQLTSSASPGLTDHDPSGLLQIDTGTINESDKALPVLLAAKGNGATTSLTVIFSEAVYTNSNGTGNLLAADFSYNNLGAGGATAIAGISEANGGDGKVTLTTTGNLAAGDDDLDEIIVAGGAIYDTAGNTLAKTIKVRVSPYLMTAETMDIDQDGVIDHFKLTFSSAVSDATFPGRVANSLGSVTTDWLISNQTNVRLDSRTAAPPNGPGDIANDAILYLAFTGSSDTAAIPDLTTTNNPGLKIASTGLQMFPLVSSSVTEADKAAPAMLSATAPTGTTALTVKFSEAVYTNSNGTGNLLTSDFVYNDVNGSGAGSLSGVSDGNGSDKSVTLTLNAAFAGGDNGTDTIASALNQIYDAQGNAVQQTRTIQGDPRVVANGTIYAMETDGQTTYLGGWFTHLGAYTSSGVLVDKTTGEKVLSAGELPKVEGFVYAVAPDGSGGFYIAGSFSRVGGQTRNSIARINADGSVHPWTISGTGATINSLCLHGTTLYFGGVFSFIGGQSRSNLAAVDVTTGNLTTWAPSVDSSVNSIVAKDSTVYVGGGFTTINSNQRNRLAAIGTDGTLLSWNPNVNNTVNTLALNADGSRLYAGGSFTLVNNGANSRNRIVAYATADHSLVTGFTPSIDNNNVRSIAVCGGLVFVGGNFTTVNSQSRTLFATIAENGTLDTNWNKSFDFSNTIIYTMVCDGTTLYVGGSFSTIDSNSRTSLAAFDVTTRNLLSWNPRANYRVNAMALGTNGIFIGGDFSALGLSERSNLAAIETSTGALLPWNPGASGTNSAVNVLKIEGNNVYIGGRFSTVAGQTRNGLAAVDKQSGVATGWDPLTNAGAYVYGLQIAGNTLYAGGSFTTVSGSTRNRLAALDISSGCHSSYSAACLTSWNPGANDQVFTLKIHGDYLYTGGYFTCFGNCPSGTEGGDKWSRNRIAAIRLDTGGISSWNPNVNNATNYVKTMAIDGSSLYIGGYFTQVNGQNRGNLARLSIDSSCHTTFDSSCLESWIPASEPNSTVKAIQILNGKVYIAGDFTSYVRIHDAITGANTTFIPNIVGQIETMQVFNDTIMIGGQFYRVNNKPWHGLATLNLSTAAVMEY